MEDKIFIKVYDSTGNLLGTLEEDREWEKILENIKGHVRQGNVVLIGDSESSQIKELDLEY